MTSNSIHHRSLDRGSAPYSDDIEMKSSTKVVTSPDPDQNSGGDDYSDWNDTGNDVRDMQRLGKKQEFKRNFSFWSALGFVSIYMATWEFVLVSLSVGFSAGGFAGLFWCFITTVTCYATIVASLAEMESMVSCSAYGCSSARHASKSKDDPLLSTASDLF
jgi:choline transport protein